MQTYRMILMLFQNMHHYFQSYGNWPISFTEYYVENITAYMDDERIFELERQVDPYSMHPPLQLCL
jgi:PhoPQ-activated pathogenicity-related protein